MAGHTNWIWLRPSVCVTSVGRCLERHPRRASIAKVSRRGLQTRRIWTTRTWRWKLRTLCLLRSLATQTTRCRRRRSRRVSRRKGRRSRRHSSGVRPVIALRKYYVIGCLERAVLGAGHTSSLRSASCVLRLCAPGVVGFVSCEEICRVVGSGALNWCPHTKWS